MSDIDHQLRNQVRDLSSLVVRVERQLGSVSQQVGGVATEAKATRGELDQLRLDFLTFVQQAAWTANVQRAETTKHGLRAQLDQEFGHYKAVRLTATGLLQAFDVGIVSQDVVTNVAEELMIQTPRYWLAPALVALAAWSSNDRSLCDRAIEEAFRRSPSRTSMFFSLILRRQGRQPSAVRWLRHYLEVTDPMALGRDFAVILEAVAQGAFGPGGRELVQEKLVLWTERLGADEAVTDAQVVRWRAEVGTYLGTTSSTAFPELAKVSPQWPRLDGALRAADAHAALVTHYQVILDEAIDVSASIEDAIDDILDRLVTEYDVEELPIQRELDLQEAILANLGDLDAARAQAAVESAAREETLDYLTIQTTAALLPDRIGVSRPTQRVAISACQAWFRQAHAEFTQEYRAQLPGDVQASFDSTHNFGAAIFKLPTWQGSFTRPMPDLEADLAAHWDQLIVPFLEKLRFNWQKAVLLPGIGIAVLFFILIGSGAYGAGFVIALVAAAILAFVMRQRFEAMEKVRREAEKALKAAKSDSLATLRQAGAELADWTTRFEQADGREAEVVRMLDAIKLAGAPAAPFDQRSVTYTAGGSR